MKIKKIQLAMTIYICLIYYFFMFQWKKMYRHGREENSERQKEKKKIKDQSIENKDRDI